MEYFRDHCSRKRTSLLLLLIVFIIGFIVCKPLYSISNNSFEGSPIKVEPLLPPTTSNSQEPLVVEINRTINITIHPSPPDDLWISLDKNNLSLIRRIAFFDGRKDFGPQLIILLFHKEAIDTFKRKLYVLIPPPPSIKQHTTKKNSKGTCVEVKLWNKIGIMQIKEKPPELHMTYMLNIRHPILFSYIPSNIHLSEYNDCRTNSLYPKLPVFYDKRPQRDDSFATCIQKGLFGDTDIQFIVDWVELNRALGASIVTILIQKHETGDKLKTALATQIKEGFVELVDWKIIIEVRDYGMSASANECIYRNVNRVKYVAVHDADEILVPQKHNTWLELMQYLNRFINTEKYASFSFRNTFWYPGDPLLTKPLCPEKPIPRYFEWTNSKIMYWPKVLINLDNTIATYCHYIWHWKQGLSREYQVPTSLGLSHHYRVPFKGKNKGWPNKGVMRRYVDTVVPRLKSIYCKSNQ